MPEQHMHTYRARIYGAYVSARDEPLAPATLAGLAPRLPYFRRLIARCMPSDREVTVLELGCGHGALLYALRQAGYANTRGVDGSTEQVAAARQLGIAGVAQGDVMQTLAETPDASVDVVIAFDVIEHFTKNELIPLVDAVYRVLKPGCRWIIHVPNSEGPFGACIRDSDFTHELSFTRFSLSQLLLASGFARAECFEDRPVPHGFKSGVRAILWQLIRLLLLGYLAVETGSVDRRAVLSQNLLAVTWKRK
ncbi:MAG: class I SAM-dependent methyltransferase [Sulfobacillus sp.]